MNRADLRQRLCTLRDDVSLEQMRGAISDLLVEVTHEWAEPVSSKVITVPDDGHGFVTSDVRAWRVEPKYGARGSEAGVHTFVYFRGIDHPLTFDGDLHEALEHAISGGKT